MVAVKCPFEGCSYETDDLPPEIVAPLLNIHSLEHSQPKVAASRGPKLNRPTIDVGVDEETWNAFVRRWETFKLGSDINEQAAPTQLFQCASDALGDLLLKADPRLTTRSTAEVMESMRSLAVIPVARGVSRAELIKMSQSDDEPIRTFAARVRGKAETCKFTTSTQCQCGNRVEANYTEEVIRDVILAGICDTDIRREALGMPEILKKTTNEVVAILEGREMARNATPNPSVAAMSTYRRQRQNPVQKPDNQKTVPCPECSKPFLQFRERSNGVTNKQPYKLCIDCFRSKKQTNAKRDSTVPHNVRAIEAEADQVSQISVLGNNHPMTSFTISLAQNSSHSATVNAVADTGAQSNVWGLADFLDAGFSTEDLQPTNIKIRAANADQMNISGQFYANIEGQAPNGEHITCQATVVVSNSLRGFYLSYKTMLGLKIIDSKFPAIGSCKKDNNVVITNVDPSGDVSVRALTSGCAHPHDDLITCQCPQRSAVPDKPSSLPFEPIPENNEKMRQWLLDTYASSTFNTCPHRALPCMSGPPMEIHIDESATPKVCNKPAPVPLHWQQRVYEDLLRDEALGVIERVPHGVPVTWCHRMVVTRKHDGTPRRTVDLSPLNKFCKRETFPAESPFHLARRVPGKTWKTVTDAWNGYHSVPLRESDRHLTTFITPFGRWRYTRAPQGFLSSGDCYNRRFDTILTDFQRKERCVDDTIHFDNDLETHWWRTIDLLHTMGAAGAVLNPEKFQFAERNVDFAGFRITDTSIEPLPKYIDAIRSFPTPKSTKDIRSWFGLVNQVSNYAQVRDYLTIFRPFLSPKYKFFWSPVLDKAFEESKELIIQSIREGVEIFDMTKPTCLRPDWSIRGIGYFLLQKHCDCPTQLPNCCPNGWRVTLAGSRFLSGAEKRYAAIEGEAMAIAWGLEQTKYFTQGCQDLLVVTDHKPLTRIFGDRTLDEINNTRLFRIKQRTLPWHFRVKHLPGKTNLAADAASRYPAPDTDLSTLTASDKTELLIAAAISRETEEITAISWSQLIAETQKDPILMVLLTAVAEGFSKEYPTLAEYAKYKDYFYICDGVVMYQDRVVVPSSLRRKVLENLHSAHQGVSSMQLRAQSIVFWPGMTADIQSTRARCTECNRNAPSQAPLPSEPAVPPSTPFEQVFGDFFEFGGHHYLVVGDRLSGWSEVFATLSGSTLSGARGLISCLRSLFATFGVPEEFSSDGGPEFTASATNEFFKNWGVKHRISSAYHPQSNGRAEVAVKSAKRLLRSNTSPNGSLNHDKFLRALLQLRNTPDPDCDLSPSQILFGRPLRDSLSFVNRLEKYSNHNIRPMWREAWAHKEEALRTRFTKSSEALNEHAKSLPPLKEGDKCFIQNQTGRYPTKWHRSGSVVETCDHNQYLVKVDGSGRVTRRNRKFLRAFKPASTSIDNPRLHDPSETAITHPHTSSDTFQGDISPDTELSGDINPTTEQESEVEAPSPEFKQQPQVEAPPPQITDTEVQPKIPAMMKRLQPFNMAGRSEAILTPREGGRPRRAKPNNN